MMPTLAFIRNNAHSHRYKDTPDNVLIAACLKADALAWDALINRYAGLIYSLCYRMGLSNTDAEDMFQDICVLLLNHLEDLRDMTKLASWLISTTKREIWRVQRRNGPILTTELGESAWKLEVAEGLHAQQSTAPDAEIMALERQQLMREALASLSDRCQQLLSLLYANDSPPSYADIATHVSVPVGSIGPNRARCLQQLREILKKLEY